MTPATTNRQGSTAAAALAAAILVSLVATAARAEPYLAIREGVHCSQCHENHTGGGKRTSFGNVYSQTVMPLYKITLAMRKEGEQREPRGFFFDPRLGDYFSLGGDLRFQNLSTLAASTTWNGAKLSAPSSNTFRIPVANLYLKGSLFGDKLMAYIDETVGPEGASLREGFLMVHHLPLESYIKAGRILLPFGMRFPDDTIFVRDATGFNYANQDLGVEVGIEPGPAFVHVALTGGPGVANAGNWSKQVTATAGAIFRPFRIGLSYAYQDNTGDQTSAIRHVGGAFMGLGIGRLALLTEGDFIRDYNGPGPNAPAGTSPGRTKWQFVWYGEADLLLYRGVNLRVAYDYQDPDVTIGNDQRTRLTVGAEVFPIPFCAIGVFYYMRRSVPQKVLENQDQIVVQLHGYL